jgi:ABC-2 type transport system ATP-binding protein
MSTEIEVTNLTKEFGEIRVLDGVDFTIQAGETFGFLGPNGAGKSTTINVLLGLLSPTTGTVRVCGHDVETDGHNVHDQVGVLPEGVSPLPHLTGAEHVSFAARANGVSIDPNEYLSYTGLDPAAHDRPASQYSTGMQQRMWLAMALVDDPDVVILDEPMTGLDPNGIREMRDVVRKLADDGTTVFFSSHRLEEVEAVCDRVGILSGGQITNTAEIGRDGVATSLAGSVDVEFRVESTNGELQSRLEARDDVTAVDIDGDWVTVSCATPQAKVDVTDSVLDTAAVSNLIAEQSSLDDMFDRTTHKVEDQR